jgi:hypothetical protein
MSRIWRSAPLRPVHETDDTTPVSTAEALHALGRSGPHDLPFLGADATAGAECELQAAVTGEAEHVDLALAIRASNYFSNVVKHAATAETPRRALTAIETFLAGNRDAVWENSWVRIPLARLNAGAGRVLDEDLRTERSNPHSPPRGDYARFLVRDSSGAELVRVPVSYLLKLALAQLLGEAPALPAEVHETGRRLMDHFISDNTSPEVLSFHVVRGSRTPAVGAALARETARRFLFTEALIQYAENVFDLRAGGQRPLVYRSPHVPLRQRAVNDAVSDAFYRELFCSPCLSGWDHGEEKHRYMQLCHEALSRSQLNAVARLRDAGIITRNLVVLPNTSNASLSNNGTHVSLGSERLRTLLADPASGFEARHEKHLGDLVIKLAEHFLPLFAGLYSAAPYRLDFADFHPEKALGYMPHELDFTHLRKLWNGWRQKARTKLLGYPMLPVGPVWLDRLLARALNFRGDLVPDIRLLDYLVALLSPEQSPALDGRLGNHERAKRDLADLGVFDPRMSFYMLLKPREFARMGFSGVEARHYSQFADGVSDLAAATELQRLTLAAAWHYVVQGGITHADIPDTRFVESERRQFVFAAAIGLKAVYVRRDTPNRFLRRVLERCERLRPSGRYRGYLKVPLADYRQALARCLRADAAALLEHSGFGELLTDLEQRLAEPERASAAARLNQGILREAGARDPYALRASEYNAAAERHYRGPLKRALLERALADLVTDLAEMARSPRRVCTLLALHALPGADPVAIVRGLQEAVLGARMSAVEARHLLRLMLLLIHEDSVRHARDSLSIPEPRTHAAPVY